MLPSEHVFKPQQVLPFMWPKNLMKHLYAQSVQNLISTVIWLKKSIMTKPCVETGHMSNQRKAEVFNEIFRIQRF
jgi:hypothetical protein